MSVILEPGTLSVGRLLCRTMDAAPVVCELITWSNVSLEYCAGDKQW